MTRTTRRVELTPAGEALYEDAVAGVTASPTARRARPGTALVLTLGGLSAFAPLSLRPKRRSARGAVAASRQA